MRELAPKNIHVAHFVIDGGMRAASRPEPTDRPDSMLDPDAIAQTYMWAQAAAQRLDLGGRAAALGHAAAVFLCASSNRLTAIIVSQ